MWCTPGTARLAFAMIIHAYSSAVFYYPVRVLHGKLHVNVNGTATFERGFPGLERVKGHDAL